jgi:prolipoprotein diacylglyceryltransferase
VHPLIPLTAVIQLTFVPIVTVGDWHVRIETIGLAVVILATLLLAVLIARRTPVDPFLRPDDPGTEEIEANHLRADDLLYIAVASLPGAVAGGRIGYVLTHLDYYGANPSTVLDSAQGGFELSLAVVGGTITAAIIAGLLGAPVRRWMHALILPLLFGLAAGKAVMVLGGDGQGLPFDGSWATAYGGPGPWGSLAPEIASHPAQLYEALATAGVLVVVMGLLAGGRFWRGTGAVFVVGIGLWAAARAAVATTWRDPAVIGPLNADQLISISIATTAVLVFVVAWLVRGLRRRRARRPVRRGDRSLDWPDPENRPRF